MIKYWKLRGEHVNWALAMQIRLRPGKWELKRRTSNTVPGRDVYIHREEG